jgi:hypothetical protein
MEEIFKNVLHDMRSAHNEAKRPRRNYERKKETVYIKPVYARWKAVVYYKDGTNRYYYSYDSVKRPNANFVDEWQSFTKLIKMILDKEGQYKMALIYATVDEIPESSKNSYDYMVARFDYYGNYKENSAVRFVNRGNDLVMNCKHLLTYGLKKLEK